MNTNLQVVTDNPTRKSLQVRYPKLLVITTLCANFPTYKRYAVPYNNGQTRMWELYKHDERDKRS